MTAQLLELEATCTSVNTRRATGKSNDLVTVPCTEPIGHVGQCVDADGDSWTRLGEILRTRGLSLAGTRVRAA